MRALTAALGLLAVGAWIAASPDTSVHSKHPIPIAIVGQEQSITWAHTVYPPLMSFRIRSGKPPEKGTIQLCQVVTEKNEVSGHVFNTISLHCEEGLVMELEGIDLSGGGQ